MFHDWDSYYLLIGSASAGLIGLMIVVGSLSTNVERESALTGVMVYLTPVVFHFGVVFVLSGMAFTPHVVPAAAAAVVVVPALYGLAYSAITARRIRHVALPEAPHWSDFWCYGAAPCAIYLALAGVAAALALHAAWSELGLGVVLMALLLIGIRNAWDLVTSLAPRNRAAEAKD
jgi:hypothetical protein